MLHIEKLSGVGKHRSAGAVARYVLAEYYQAEPGQEGYAVSRWSGKLAERLGLTGEVNPNDLRQMLDGFNPKTGQKLVKNAGDRNHRFGDDLTFSPNKTVSLAFAVADPAEQQRLITDTQEASKVAIDYITHGLTDSKGRPLEGYAVAMFEHFSSRAKDIDLHTHAVLLNLADIDGKIKGFPNPDGFRLIRTRIKEAGAVYEAELANRLLTRGYQLVQYRERNAHGFETGNLNWKIAGFDRETELACSERHEEIAKLKQDGMTDRKASKITRAKKEANYQEVMAKTHDKLAKLGVSKTTQDLLGQSELPEWSDSDILKRCHRQQSAFTVDDLIREVAKTKGAKLGARGCVAEAKEILQRSQCLKLAGGHYASQEQKAIEDRISQSAFARADDQAVRLNPLTVKQAIATAEATKGYSFTDEQKRNLKLLTQDTGGTACLVGWAGTGKTTMTQATKLAFEAEGKTVLGASTAWKASTKLFQETGIKSTSIKRLISNLEKGKQQFDRNTVLIVDEAGMVGAEPVSYLQSRLDEAGGKLILMGDDRQLQPLMAGSGLTLARVNGNTANQTEIRRQKDEANRQMATDFYTKDSQTIMADLARIRAFHLAEDNDQAKAKLVGDYLKDDQANKFIIARTNAEVASLNLAVRAGLKDQGKLDPAKETKLTVLGELEGESHQLGFCPGDRIRFTIRNEEAGFDNGTTAEVLAIKNNKLVFSMDGKTASLATDQPLPVQYDYAGTVHKGQGQTYTHTYWLTDGMTDRELALVSCSRHTDRLGIYTTTEGKEELASSIQDFAPKRNVRDYALAESLNEASHQVATWKQAEDLALAEKREEQAKQEQIQAGVLRREEMARENQEAYERCMAIEGKNSKDPNSLLNTNAVARAEKAKEAKGRWEEVQKTKTEFEEAKASIAKLEKGFFKSKQRKETIAVWQEIKDEIRERGNRLSAEAKGLDKEVEAYNQTEESLRTEVKALRRANKKRIEEWDKQPQEVKQAYKAKEEAKQEAEAKKQEQERIEREKQEQAKVLDRTAIRWEAYGEIYETDIDGKKRYFNLEAKEWLEFLKAERLPEGNSRDLAFQQFDDKIVEQFKHGVRFETRPLERTIEPPQPKLEPQLSRGFSLGM